MGKRSYFYDFFVSITYGDNFGWNDVYKQEKNKYLKSIYDIDEKHYELKKRDIATPKKIDELVIKIKSLAGVRRIKTTVSSTQNQKRGRGGRN